MKQIFLTLAIFLIASSFADEHYNYTNLGGKNSINNVSSKAFSQFITTHNRDITEKFFQGRLFFKSAWVAAPASTKARDGLGPLYSSNSCIGCHPKNGAGNILKKGALHKSLVLRLSNASLKNDELLKKNGFIPDAVYGAQVSSHANANILAEAKPKVSFKYSTFTYPDGKKVTLRIPSFSLDNLNYGTLDKNTKISPRLALALIGLGEIEKIPENEILKHQDIKDRDSDGISGKANYVYDILSNTTKLGRFTWKASAPSVLQQSAAAFSNDMGISSELFSQENCTKAQSECLKKASKEFDINLKRLSNVAFYLQNIKIPAQREANKHIEGAKLFTQLGCVKCHVSTFKTIEGNTIHPFSDFLLHDMGSELDDARGEFLATSSEWRTPPLWGIGLYKKVNSLSAYLHDGRASTLEEAILWHGGEAKSSREAFVHLKQRQREQLLSFLNSI